MWIMNLVWPITMLYAGPIGLWFYSRVGRNTRKRHPAFAYAIATTHCGAGCTLGDIIAESCIFLYPSILLALGYRSLWQYKIFSGWILDFVLAFALGILFQYFTIVPMKQLSPARGLLAALKADTLSLTAWQIGMYGWMAIATFAIFRHELEPSEPVFWWMMQIGMLAGFATSYPVNLWLVNRGIKEAMR